MADLKIGHYIWKTQPKTQVWKANLERPKRQEGGLKPPLQKRFGIAKSGFAPFEFVA